MCCEHWLAAKTSSDLSVQILCPSCSVIQWSTSFCPQTYMARPKDFLKRRPRYHGCKRSHSLCSAGIIYYPLLLYVFSVPALLRDTNQWRRSISYVSTTFETLNTANISLQLCLCASRKHLAVVSAFHSQATQVVAKGLRLLTRCLQFSKTFPTNTTRSRFGRSMVQLTGIPIIAYTCFLLAFMKLRKREFAFLALKVFHQSPLNVFWGSHVPPSYSPQLSETIRV